MSNLINEIGDVAIENKNLYVRESSITNKEEISELFGNSYFMKYTI